MPSNFDQYKIRPYGTTGSTLHGQLLEFLQEGEAWLGAQRPKVEWEAVLNMLSAQDDTANLQDQSNTGFNNGKRITKEIVASLSNFRHEGEIKVTWDQSLYDAASALTKRDRSWFKETHAHHRYRSIMQYAVALGTGYAYQTWDSSFWGPGRGDVKMIPLAPDCVYCVQIPSDHDLQRAYMVIIKEELPINLARRIYQKTNLAFAMALKPDRDAPGWLEKGLRKLQDLSGGSPIFRLAGLDKRNAGHGSYPTVDIFHAYIMDDSVNTGPIPRIMGTHGTNWEYEVPVLGSQIPTGMNDASGAPKTREANHDDAALFPLRRLCIFSRSVDFPAYDGSSPWWHGRVPLGRFRFNDWAWEPLGQSVVGDTRNMQAGIESMMRDIEDSTHARMDPPMLYDDQKVSKGFAEQINPRRAGVRAAASLDFGEIFKLVGAQWQYEVPDWIQEYLDKQIGRMEKLTGSPDLVAIAKAKQVPSESTLEKLLEMAGPMTQDMIASVEEPLYDLGEMRKALYLQFDSRERMLSLTGNLPGETVDFKYSPNLIVPIVKGETAKAREARTRRYINEFKYHITQSGINEIHRMSTKLAYLQLKKAGAPISWFTVMKLWQVPNIGPLPKNPETGKEVSNEMETWVAEQHITKELAVELAKETGDAGGAPGPGAGRPPTNQKPPQMVQKDGGTRTAVKTS